MSKGFALALVPIILTASSSMVTFLDVKAQGRTIIVPNDYGTISNAVGNATDGDTILVKSGTYEESNLVTNKSILTYW
jgi:hypothetical protein